MLHILPFSQARNHRISWRIRPVLEVLEDRTALSSEFGIGSGINLPSLAGPGQRVAEVAAKLASVDLPAIQALDEASAIGNALDAKDAPLTERPGFGSGTPTHAPGNAATGLVNFQSWASDGDESETGEKPILWHEPSMDYGTGADNDGGNVIESNGLAETKTGTRETTIYGSIDGGHTTEVIGHEEHTFQNGRLVSVRREYSDGRIEWDDDPDPFVYYPTVYYPSDSEAGPIDWGMVTPPIQVVPPDSNPRGPLVSPVDVDSISLVHGSNRSGILDWKQWSSQPPPEGQTGGNNDGHHDPARFVQPPVNPGGGGGVDPTNPSDDGPGVGPLA